MWALLQGCKRDCKQRLPIYLWFYLMLHSLHHFSAKLKKKNDSSLSKLFSFLVKSSNVKNIIFFMLGNTQLLIVTSKFALYSYRKKQFTPSSKYIKATVMFLKSLEFIKMILSFSQFWSVFSEHESLKNVIIKVYNNFIN